MMGELTDMENFRGESDRSRESKSQVSLQCETFRNKFGHFKSYKAILADPWNLWKFGICFGHRTARYGAVQQFYDASHKCEPHI